MTLRGCGTSATSVSGRATEVRVFLDVGAHEGQTLDEVVKARWGFDAVHAFEPVPAQFDVLSRRFGDVARVHLEPFGLGGVTGVVPVYGDNVNMGASMFAAKNDVDAGTVTSCRVVRASDWFATLPLDADVYLKLNCEGGEHPIILDLCGSGEIHRVTHAMVDFDVRKIPGMEHAEAEIVAAFDAAGFDRWAPCERVMRGVTHQDRIACWLDGVVTP